jgi:hypothetical protein
MIMGKNMNNFELYMHLLATASYVEAQLIYNYEYEISEFLGEIRAGRIGLFAGAIKIIKDKVYAYYVFVEKGDLKEYCVECVNKIRLSMKIEDVIR